MPGRRVGGGPHAGIDDAAPPGRRGSSRRTAVTSQWPPPTQWPPPASVAAAGPGPSEACQRMTASGRTKARAGEPRLSLRPTAAPGPGVNFKLLVNCNRPAAGPGGGPSLQVQALQVQVQVTFSAGIWPRVRLVTGRHWQTAREPTARAGPGCRSNSSDSDSGRV